MGLKKFILKKLGIIKMQEEIRQNTEILRSLNKGAPIVQEGIVEIGEFSYLMHGCIVHGYPRTTIGCYSSIAPYAAIGIANHPIDWLSIHPFQYGHTPTKIKQCIFSRNKETVVGNDVWIGYGAVIVNGVSIGDGAIIGAGAIVTKDVPPYAIVTGIPATVLKYRFPPDIINALLELRWWDLEIQDLDGVEFDKIENAIEQIKEIKKHRPMNHNSTRTDPVESSLGYRADKHH